MPDFNLKDYGIVGGVIVFLYLVIVKVLDTIGQYKKNSTSDGDKDKEKEDDELRKLLSNNTQALVELTQFLKMQAAVDKEKEKQSNKQADIVEEKIDRIIELLNTHCTKCESICYKKE